MPDPEDDQPTPDDIPSVLSHLFPYEILDGTTYDYTTGKVSHARAHGVGAQGVRETIEGEVVDDSENG